MLLSLFILFLRFPRFISDEGVARMRWNDEACVWCFAKEHNDEPQNQDLILFKMKTKVVEKLKSLSKDASSFEQLKQMFGKLNTQKECAEANLDILERAIENDYDSILITKINLEKPGPEIVYVNDGFTKITGYSREEVIGKSPRILQGPKTDKATLERLKNRLKNGRAFFGQAVNYRKDGSEFINQWDIHPLTDEQGNLSHWVSYQHDITERKQAEKTVINTHAEFDKLRETSKSTLLDVNLEGDIISANKSFRNLIGYVKDELKGKKVWKLFPRKYSNSLKTRFEKSFDKRDFDEQCLKGIIKHKKGFPIQIEGVASVLELKERTIIRAEIKNITLQKRIMETLQKRNQEYSKIVDKATQFKYRLSLAGGKPEVEYVSESFTKVTGLSAEAIIKSGDWEKLIHQEDRQKVRDHLNKVFEGTSHTCEYRIHMRDGSYKKIVDYAKPGTCKKNGEEECVRGAISFLPEKEMA